LEFDNDNSSLNKKNSNIYFLIKNYSENLDIINREFENLNLNSKIVISLNKKIFDYALKSKGRLDIYAKAHFIVNLINALEKIIPNMKSNLKNLEILYDFETMEKDLLQTILMGEAEKFTKIKLDLLIEKFSKNLIARNNETNTMKDLKKLLILHQNIDDQESIKLLENILVKLMGHPEVN